MDNIPRPPPTSPSSPISPISPISPAGILRRRDAMIPAATINTLNGWLSDRYVPGLAVKIAESQIRDLVNVDGASARQLDEQVRTLIRIYSDCWNVARLGPVDSPYIVFSPKDVM